MWDPSWRFPVFLAPGTDFVEDKFSTDWGQGSGFRMIQDSSMLFIAHFISNLMLLVIWREVLICGLEDGNPAWHPTELPDSHAPGRTLRSHPFFLTHERNFSDYLLPTTQSVDFSAPHPMLLTVWYLPLFPAMVPIIPFCTLDPSLGKPHCLVCSWSYWGICLLQTFAPSIQFPLVPSRVSGLPPCESASSYAIAFMKQSFIGQFISVAQSCPTLCDPMDCSTPGLPAHH